MKIRITKFITPTTVHAFSPIGLLHGEWVGKTPENEEYEVELSIDNIFSYKLVDKVRDIYFMDGKTYVTGLIEDEDSDGIRYVRIGDDLIMLDIDGQSLINQIIEVKTDTIKLFPI